MTALVFEERTQSDGFDLYKGQEKIGEVTFVKLNEDAISINHTEVDKKFQGKGYGKYLVDKVIELAQEKNWKLSASCWFAEKVIQSSE